MHANDSVKANPATMANSIAILIGADVPPPTPLRLIVIIFECTRFRGTSLLGKSGRSSYRRQQILFL